MSYHIHVVDKSVDGLLGVLFEHKSLKYNFVVLCCYLPPEDSPWGRDDVGLFWSLTNPDLPT